MTVPLVLSTVRVSRTKKERTQEQTQVNEQIFGKGVMTAWRNQYRKTGGQKKK